MTKKLFFWIIILLVFATILAVFITQQKIHLSSPKIEVLDCSDNKKSCETVVIQNTIKNCREWYKAEPGSYCENTTENIEKVTLITDASNHVKSPLSNIKYSTSIETPGLKHPWDLEFLPDGTALITQKNGKLMKYMDGELGIVADLNVIDKVSVGLMGLAIDPHFPNNYYIYLYYAASYDAAENKAQGRSEHYIFSKISRFTLRDGKLSDEKVLLDKIPGSIIHAGGALEFGPDGKLYATTGDGQLPEKSQDPNDLRGKILRINPDGTVPSDNPFEKSYVYSMGHRNVQNMSWHPVTQEFFVSEHGQWRYDEINLITKGTNYGWPAKQCDELFPENPISILPKGLQDPHRCFKDWTLAPSGATFVDDESHPWFGDLFVAGLRSKHLHRFEIENGEIVRDEIFYVNEELNGLSRRFRDVEFFDGALWVIGDLSGIVKISPLP